SNLYNNLGVSPEERLSARVVHCGLSGRTLGSSTSDRYIEPVRTTESSSQGEFATSVSSLRENIVDHVKQILAPMFTLFEYETIEDGVYSDIVNKFINGYVT
ncbi:MAG: hypothetical protein IMZ53_02420, partial [Thermoplasmata archaeon]|nr:hypothetical protein [Thermoplasmata archaeon]